MIYNVFMLIMHGVEFYDYNLFHLLCSRNHYCDTVQKSNGLTCKNETNVARPQTMMICIRYILPDMRGQLVT